MALDYDAIRRDNERRYGTDIGRFGRILLADRYDDRTHFIFELLQNAEDALARRAGWQVQRAVSFKLTKKALRVSHFGEPFNEADVRGICGIAESNKDLTAIGHFGIGFKSVYALTDRPEVHSGAEAFAIESFVWPVAVRPIDRDPDETVILIPFRPGDESGYAEITAGLGRLDASTLLFLRQIQEIDWSTEDAGTGLYRRESEELDPAVRRVTLIGQDSGQGELDESWLVFSRPVSTDGGYPAGHVEIAWSLVSDKRSGRDAVQRIEHSPLVVFFPTVVETHLGFLVQGPYRTTPSRDNVPRNDSWNQYLVHETSTLLVEALRWLRDHDFLDAAALRCLPLDPAKFRPEGMFRPFFDVTRGALHSEPLLPRFDTSHVAAVHGRLGRTQELRELFTPDQLTALYQETQEITWLSGDITPDRAPELHRYLTQELNVVEVIPGTIISLMDREFLESQSDEWIVKFYEFLSGQPALARRFGNLPLIRLEDGNHVPARVNGQFQAFLPGTVASGFPTVRTAVCAEETARGFLRSLGLTEPDPIDDVIRNILPKYRMDEADVSDDEYEADIKRIVAAFATDSKAQREKLISALQETSFVMVVDAGDGSKWISRPGVLYLTTDRLKKLFEGVEGILLVDDTYACLRGADVRKLLEACGAAQYLKPVPVGYIQLSEDELRQIRRNAGLERATSEAAFSDVTLQGLDRILELLPQLEPEARRDRAALLWDALADVEGRPDSGVFAIEYSWSYSHQQRTASIDAAFVRQLNESAWVPDPSGELQRPEFVLFDSLDWKQHPFLQSKIHFKPPAIEQLAREAGIEPGVLDLLKMIGVTSVAELRERLGIPDGGSVGEKPQTASVQEAVKSLLGGTPDPKAPASYPGAQAVTPLEKDRVEGKGSTDAGSRAPDEAGTRGSDRARDGDQRTGVRAGQHSPTSTHDRESFVSYVAVQPDEEERDPDGLDQKAREAVETQAIEHILSREPMWQRAPGNNAGFDLFQANEHGDPIRWCEVKAMSGSLRDRPVGVSQAQFEFARQHGEAYWLYIVEHAGDAGRARIVRIQDPAGKARTFTFDHGWLHVAEVVGDAAVETSQDPQEE